MMKYYKEYEDDFPLSIGISEERINEIREKLIILSPIVFLQSKTHSEFLVNVINALEKEIGTLEKNEVLFVVNKLTAAMIDLDNMPNLGIKMN